MNEVVYCARCYEPVKVDGRSVACTYCGFQHELGDVAIEMINQVINSERPEVTTAFFRSAYYMNQYGGGNRPIEVSTNFAIMPLDLIIFDRVVIAQAESGENDQNV